MGSPEYQPGEQPIRRACDQCRRSKTRCDKKVPCSSCRSAKKTCTTSGAEQSGGLQRKQRIHISSLYEQKIDRIEASLGSIERLLKRRSANKSSPSDDDVSDTIASPNATVTISDASTINTPAHIDQNEPEPDQGLNVQTDMTVALLKQAVRSTTLYGVDTKMGAALGSLYDLIGKRHLSSPGGSGITPFPMQKPVPPGGVGKLEMPPLQVTVAALRRLTGRTQTLLTMLCSSVGLDDIEGVCKRAYEHLDNISSVEFVLVSSLQYYIFEESCMLALSPELIAEYQAHAQLCKENVDTGLANLPLLLSSTAQNVQGILLGAFASIDQSRPAVAWQLVTTAAQLCIAAGFQKLSSAANKAPEVVRLERMLFWNIYILDKALCLRLNRGSCIPEYDIDIPREFDFEFSMSTLNGTKEMTNYWIRASITQGRMYEHLYSPAARAAPAATRLAHAKALAADCKGLLQEVDAFQAQYPSDDEVPVLTDIFRTGEQIQLSVNLTLVYQAVSALDEHEEFKYDCVEAARRAIRTHKRSMYLMSLGHYARSTYINWTILHTPFAPFFVILRHVLETLSINDLVLLQEFIQSLSLALDVSSRLQRFYQLCQVMCEVAGLFVGVKLKLNNSNVTVPDMPQALDNVNHLLSQQYLGQQTQQQQQQLEVTGQEQQANIVFPQQQQQLQQQTYNQSLDKQAHGIALQQQGLVNVLPVGDDSAVVGDAAALEMPADWDPATMGTMDWTAGYENILNLLQDELQILENYPNAGLF